MASKKQNPALQEQSLNNSGFYHKKGMIKIKDIPTKTADVEANLVEQTWLTRYPRPEKLIHDQQGNSKQSLLKSFAKIIG
jgi:hypothetical protein